MCVTESPRRLVNDFQFAFCHDSEDWALRQKLPGFTDATVPYQRKVQKYTKRGAKLYKHTLKEEEEEETKEGRGKKK